MAPTQLTATESDIGSESGSGGLKPEDNWRLAEGSWLLQFMAIGNAPLG